jgi:DnaK suppressor protein
MDGIRDGIRRRLEQELETAISRLRPLNRAMAVEELPRGIGCSWHFADEVDAIQASESREIGLATRELLVTRVNHLVVALDQLNEGEYGTCGECGEPVAPARLRAMPEVQCCVRCQDRLEHIGRRA